MSQRAGSLVQRYNKRELMEVWPYVCFTEFYYYKKYKTRYCRQIRPSCNMVPVLLAVLLLMKKLYRPTGLQRHALAATALAAAFLFSGCVGVQKVAAPYRPDTARDTRLQQTTDATEYETYNRDVVRPSVARINGRIASYEERLQSWQDAEARRAAFQLSIDLENKRQRCQQQVVEILSGYRQLHVALLRTQSVETSRQLLHSRLPEIQSKDIAYIEGPCTGFLASLDQTGPGKVSEQVISGPSLSALLESGAYQEVINAFDTLPVSPGQYPAFDDSYSYGVALLKTGREYEARRVLNDLYVRSVDLDQISQGNLIRLLADLNFGLGDFATAKKRYQELRRIFGEADANSIWAKSQLAALDYSYDHTDQVQSYASLLKKFLAYNAPRDGFAVSGSAELFLTKYPRSQLQSNVLDLKKKSDRAAEKWFADLLTEIDRLSSEQKEAQALELIGKIPPAALPADKLAILRLTKARLGAGQEGQQSPTDGIYEEIIEGNPSGQTASGTEIEDGGNSTASGVSAADEGLQRTWTQAMADMQARNYDQSIELFSGLLHTSYADRARERIREASLLAAQKSRKEAAELFVRSNRATDTQARRKLLVSSRALLESILRKYPQSGLENKVRRNLHKIDQELSDIDQTRESIPQPVEHNFPQQGTI